MLKIKSLLFVAVIIIIGITAFISCEDGDLPKDDKGVIISQEDITLDSENSPIGMIEGKSITILNEKQLKEDWAKIVNTNPDLDITYDVLSIVQEENRYYLKGRDTEKYATSKTRLILIENEFFRYKEEGSGFITTVTCSGCNSTTTGDCEPIEDPQQGWMCTSCSQGTCKKSTTTSTTD